MKNLFYFSLPLKFAAMRRVLLIISISLCCFLSKAQNNSYRQYIDNYKDYAIEQMQRYGVPASITLAQGLLESGAGQSFLAKTANNHFGIKTGGTWAGPYVLKDDDKKGEKFRKYDSPRQSFEDHSLFLTSRSRYASLFQLDKTDYQGWARGLKAAGYATNPRYANLLIGLIDSYDLAQYDRIAIKGNHAIIADERHHWHIATTAQSVSVKSCNGLRYVVVTPGSDLKFISRQTDVSERRLKKYNELPDNYTVRSGDVLFLEKKKKKAARKFKHHPHIIKPGESLYTIAQRYGVRLKNLYKMNHFANTYQARVGDSVRLY